MNGLMMEQPLLISSLLVHADIKRQQTECRHERGLVVRETAPTKLHRAPAETP